MAKGYIITHTIKTRVEIVEHCQAAAEKRFKAAAEKALESLDVGRYAETLTDSYSIREFEMEPKPHRDRKGRTYYKVCNASCRKNPSVHVDDSYYEEDQRKRCDECCDRP